MICLSRVRAAGLLGAGILLVGAVSGCGGTSSGSSTASGESDAAVEARIGRERADAAAQAKQAEQIKELKTQVKSLSKRATTATKATAAAPAASTVAPASATSSEEVRAFHTLSGNVSCEVTAVSARCSIASSAITFVLPAGRAAYVDQGAALTRGAGALRDWATSISIGSITCQIPPETVASGVRCSDSSTGHGFEASKVPARQKAY